VAGGLMGEKPSSGHPGTNGTDRDSMVLNPDGFWGKSFILVVIRYRMWPAILDFFTLHFDDPASEDRYRKETWFLQKTLSIWSAFFLIMNWVTRQVICHP
jgi:osomolarity two-component system sensor histidine kinase SLN1